MRVSELAELAGTTVRAVRHYQSLGLLDTPESGSGRRSYDFAHMARLSRIRWLVAAGVPLHRIGEILGDDETEPVAGQAARDLRSTLKSIDDQLTELQGQRDRLATLLERAEAGDGLSPMPPVVERFYANTLAMATDEETRSAIRRERDLVEVACYQGEFPAGAELIYVGYDQQRLVRSVEAFATDRSDLPEDELTSYAREVVDRIVADLGDQAVALARTIDVDAVTHFYARAIKRTDHVGEQRVWRAVLAELLTRIEELKNA